MQLRSFAGALGLAVLAPVVSAQGKVIVVDAAGGGAFTDLRAAVDAAADGDLVLVKDGVYDTFTVQGKSITVTADLGADVEVLNWLPVHVTATAPGDRVVVRGIRSTGITGTLGTFGGFSMTFNSGDVWLEDVESCGQNTVSFSTPGTVVYQRATMTGTCPTAIPGPGQIGLAVIEGNVFAFDSTFTAGDLAGLSGVSASIPSLVFLSNVDAFGGTGATGDADACVDGGQGGDGLEIHGFSTQVVVLDSTYTPGTGGTGGGGCSATGPDGDPISISSGTLTVLSGVGRSLEATSPVRAGTSTTVTATGLPGDLALVLFSTEPEALLALQFKGAFLTTAPQVLTLGTLQGFPGQIVQEIPIPPLDPGLEFVEVFAQIAVLDALGNPQLGGGSVIDVLSPIF